jgi:hypothetical protein
MVNFAFRIDRLLTCLFFRVTCSHVGHIYRGPRRRSMHPRGGNLHQSHINHMRVAEV